jgi:O-antigen ligase
MLGDEPAFRQLRGVANDTQRQLMTKISLGLLAVMVSGPFLLPIHTAPIPSFWAEWWVGALGLAAALAGLFGTRERLVLPGSLLIPTLLLATLLLQFAFGRIAFEPLGLLFANYLLFATLLMILGRQLVVSEGLGRLAEVLAIGFVLGALVGTAAALVQWMGFADRVAWVFTHGGSGVYGNLGQVNHHTHQVWLGIVSAFYLSGRGHISRRLLWLLVLTLGFGSVLGGSRSVFLYAGVLAGALVWWRRSAPPGTGSTLLIDAAMLIPVLLALSLAGGWLSSLLPEILSWIGVADGKAVSATMPGARLYDEVSGPSIRVDMMRTAWLAFAEHPWLGQGVGNYAWGSFMAAALQTEGDRLFVSEHAHNLVFQLLAEFGAPATLMAIAMVAWWARGFLRQPWRLEHAWCACVIGLGAMHSMTEYPLWYSYFLGPTALILGATDRAQAVTLVGRRIAFYLLLIGLGGMAILGNLRSDYSTIEAISNRPLAADLDRERAWRISMESLLRLREESLLSPWAMLGFATLAEPSHEQAEYRARLCKRGILFSTARPLVTRCAMQLALAGAEAEARELVGQVLRAYPMERSATRDQLRAGAERFPELESLRAMAAEGADAPR